MADYINRISCFFRRVRERGAARFTVYLEAAAGWKRRLDDLCLRYPLLARVCDRPERKATGLLVAALHAIIIMVLLNIKVFTPAEEETFVMIGGVFSPTVNAPERPREVTPEMPQLPPPVIEMPEAIIVDAAPPLSGSPNVTTPAQALAEAHAFPAIPASLKVPAPRRMRLLLSISETGSVTEANILESSGSEPLDAYVVAWIKQNWRYSPARRNGVLTAVTTTALVQFDMG